MTTRSRADLIGAVERIYHLEGTDAEWLARVAEPILALIGGEGPACGYFYDASDPGDFRLDDLIAWDDEDGSAAAIPTAQRTLPAAAIRALHWTGPHLSSAADALKRIMTLDDIPGWVRLADRSGADDAIALRSLDPSHRGVNIGQLRRARGGVPRMSRRAWEQLGGHLSAACRLRRRLRTSGGSLLDAGEAVLAPDGACLHARDDARPASAREALREAAVAIDRSRAELRRDDPEGALEMWRGLVDGTWSLIDHFDSDGRRYLVAHRNRPDLRDLRRLTAREHLVASWVALGHSNKLIAYQLGLAQGTVAAYLHTALRKLGLARRGELIQLLNALDPPSELQGHEVRA